jgi:hypothetical protein
MNGRLATPKLNSLAGRAASRVPLADQAASRAPGRAAASDHENAADAQTPFYNHLMSMIDETAQENRRVQQDHAVPALLAPAPRWRIGHLLTVAAGLTVALAVASAVIEAGLRATRPTTVAADTAPEKVSQKSSPVVVVAGTVAAPAPVPVPAPAPVSTPVPAAEPDNSRSIDSKGKGATKDSIETGSIMVKGLDEPPTKPADMPAGAEEADSTSEPGKEAVKATAEPGDEALKVSVKEIAKDTAAESPVDDAVATKTANTDAIAPAETAPSEKAAPEAPSAPPPEAKADAIVSAPIRVARIISDVNMRSGPSNSQPVVTTIARGSTVEMLECRAWCEVIFRGQRGWVYKGFIGAPHTAHRR